MFSKSIKVNNHSYTVEFPEKCPLCHHHGEIQALKTVEAIERSEIQVVFQCAFSGCRSFFIGYYGPFGNNKLKALKPMKPNPTAFPEEVTKLSPTFSSVFREAEEAFHLGLTQIAGPGYRKAFEFLVKDYAKSLVPDKVKHIEQSFSGTVVSDYITDPRIQAVAKRALWLGNDEAHYLRKWETHDLDDLINLIRLVVSWIEIDQLSKHYNSSIPS